MPRHVHPAWSPNELEIEIWASRETSTPDREFYPSHSGLEQSLLDNGIAIEWFTNGVLEEGHQVSRGAPPDIVQFIVQVFEGFAGSGLAVGLYKALDLWVKKVNGRRVSVKIGDIELNTTQLTELEFVRLLDKVMEYKRSLHHSENSDEALRATFSNYQLVTEPDRERGPTIVYGDILHMAQRYFILGYYDAAAETCLRQLKDHLRMLGYKHGIAGTVTTPSQLNDELHRAKVYGVSDHKSVATWLRFFKSAAQGDDRAYAEEQVERMMLGVRSFISHYPA